jgi:4-amino-4-deoxy-L-arabinose transferase-like glycosyltransferase
LVDEVPDDRLRSMRDPTRLRVPGFALTAAGALLAGIGSTLVWTTTGLREDARGVLDLDFRGLDLVEGILSLLVAAASLAVLLAMPRLHRTGRVRGAIGLLIAGAVLVALPVSVALRAEDLATREMARVVANTAGLSEEEAIELVRTDPDLAVRVDTSGVWLSIAGGALVVVGAMIDLAWARRSEEPFPVGA